MNDNKNEPELTYLLAEETYNHHNPSSGYAQLANYVPCIHLSRSQIIFNAAPEGSIQHRIGMKLFDLSILFNAWRTNVIHFLYAESHLRILYYLIKKLFPKTRTIATLHLPLDYYDINKSLAALSHLDAIITLCNTQAKQVKQYFPNKPVFFIPHGVTYNKGVYDLSTLEKESAFNLVTIGANYRDWDTLHTVISKVSSAIPKCHFHLVGLPESRKQPFISCENVTIHPRLSEIEYYSLLNRCHLLFLPLTFASANNALLEAYSVGLPALCTDLPGIHDYATPTLQTFHDPDSAISLIDTYAKLSLENLREQRATTHEAGKRFLWKNIALQSIRAYNEAFKARH